MEYFDNLFSKSFKLLWRNLINLAPDVFDPTSKELCINLSAIMILFLSVKA